MGKDLRCARSEQAGHAQRNAMLPQHVVFAYETHLFEQAGAADHFEGIVVFLTGRGGSHGDDCHLMTPLDEAMAKNEAGRFQAAERMSKPIGGDENAHEALYSIGLTGRLRDWPLTSIPKWDVQ